MMTDVGWTDKSVCTIASCTADIQQSTRLILLFNDSVITDTTNRCFLAYAMQADVEDGHIDEHQWVSSTMFHLSVLLVTFVS